MFINSFTSISHSCVDVIIVLLIINDLIWTRVLLRRNLTLHSDFCSYPAIITNFRYLSAFCRGIASHLACGEVAAMLRR